LKELVEWDFVTPRLAEILSLADSGSLDFAETRLRELLEEEELKVAMALPIPKAAMLRLNLYPGLYDIVVSYRKKLLRMKKRGYDRFPSSPWLCNSLQDLAAEYVYNIDFTPFNRLEGLKACTFGSCFAMNIKQALEKRGVQAETIHNVEDFNNPFINEKLLSLDFCHNADSQEWYVIPSSSFAREVDRHDRSLYAQGKQEQAFSSRFGRLKLSLESSNIIIFSIGTAYILRDSLSGNILIESNANPFAQKNELLSVDQVASSLRQVCQQIREINTSAPVFLTLSPIPLWAISGTQGLRTAIEADCLSKSTCRLAVDLLMSEKIEDVYYYPSFEMIRWLAPSIQGIQVWTDPRHLSWEEVIEPVTSLFCTLISSNASNTS